MKKLQLIDMTLLLQLVIGMMIILFSMGHLVSIRVLIVIVVTNILGSLGLSFCFIMYSRKFSQKAFYNPIIKKVEIHIGRSSSPMKMAISCLEAIRLGKKMKQNVLFYTNHFPEERLKEKWGDKIMITPTNLFRKILFYIPYYLVTFGRKKGKQYPLIQCEIVSSKF